MATVRLQDVIKNADSVSVPSQAVPVEQPSSLTNMMGLFGGAASEVGARAKKVITDAGDEYEAEPTVLGKAAVLGKTPLRLGGEAAKMAGEALAVPIKKAGEALSETEMIKEAGESPELTGIESLAGMIGRGLSGALGAVKDKVGEPVYQSLKDTVELFGLYTGGRAAKPGVDTAATAAKEAADLAARGAKGAADVTVDAAKAAADQAKKSLFGRPPKSIDDVVAQADDAMKTDLLSAKEQIAMNDKRITELENTIKLQAKDIEAGKTAGDLGAARKEVEMLRTENEGLKAAATRKTAEATTALPSLTEKWAGISPDIKNRIAGKQDKLKEYFDVAHARNLDDTLPTPLEHGARRVEEAVTKMEALLGDTGGKIGQFRQKVGNYTAKPDSMKAVETSFGGQLSKLNLEVKNGAIRQIPGTVRRVASDNEVNVLNDLYKDLLVVKQNPSLEKLIDLRMRFDRKINFEKSSREVSSSLDPLSRTVRKQIADVAAEIVGKSEASNLKKYSDLMEAYEGLRAFTDRKAGSEFLLKQVLSERGRLPREVMDAIKENTGIDLMDDAVMSSIATDLIGNSRQKGVFRQELLKSGLDVEAALAGDKAGAARLFLNFLKKGLIDEEKTYLKAAE